MIKAFKEIIRENIHNFSGTVALATVNQRRMYRSSDLGWFWALVKPLFYLCIFYFAISIGFRHAKDIDGIICPYFVWLMAGMIPWFYMRDMILGGAGCFRKYKYLVTRSTFPVSTIPSVIAVSFLYIHVIMIGIGFVICICFKTYPSIYWLQIPIYALFMVLLTVIWNMASGLLAVISGDFMDLLKAVNPAFFWLSGILFNSRPLEHAQIFFKLNPITYIVEGYRNAMCYHIWFWEDMESFGYFILVLAVMAIVAVWLYKKLRRVLPDII